MAAVNPLTGLTLWTNSGATTTNTYTSFNPLWSYGLTDSGGRPLQMAPGLQPNDVIPETAEAWLRRRVRETCEASGLAP